MENNLVDESILGKLKKLKILKEQGIYSGERENAEFLLNKLLEKYNLKYEDIFSENEERKEYAFRYSSEEEKKLYFHCIANVFGTDSEIWKNAYYYKDGTMRQYLKLTSFEYAIFSDFYNFHRNCWKEYEKKQRKTLMQAYIHAQGIYDISPKSLQDESSKKNIDIKELMSILALSDQLKDKIPQYRKALK